MANLHLDSGALTPQHAIEAINEVSLNVENLKNIIGDVNGYGTGIDNSYKTSVSESIGDFSKVSPNIPVGVVFSDYTDSFSSVGINDFYLTLIPIGDLTIRTYDNKTYIKVEVNDLKEDNQYSVIGRKLLFLKNPIGTFTVSYKGTYPGSEYGAGFTPNCIPSPSLLAENKITKPSVVKVSDRVYEVTVSSSNIYDKTTYQKNVDFVLKDKFTKFISSTGAILAPKEEVSVWKLFNGEYQKIDDANIYLMSPSKYRFETSIPINTSDTFVLSVNNWTVSDSLALLFKFAFNHSHNGEELGSQILHSSLSGLRASRYNQADRRYGISNIQGDDHPQYFNREGYIQNNDGNFNNAIIGDVLIGSSDPHNLYNNTVGNSRKIYFGSVSDAVSLLYDFAFKGLKLYGSENGLKIETHANPNNPDNSYAVALELDGNKIYSTGDKNSLPNTLNIESKNGVTKFVNTEGGLSKIIAKTLNINDIVASGNISITDPSSTLTIGGVKFANSDGNVNVSSGSGNKITFGSDVDLSNINVENMTPKTINIKGEGKILFGTQDGATLTEKDNSIVVTSKLPVVFDGSGKNTGIQNKNATYNPYMNIYTSAKNGGSSTPTDHDTYIEAGKGDIYFLKDSTVPQVENGISYGFGDSTPAGSTRLDNLTSWPKSNIHASVGNFKSTTVAVSSLRERRGVNFGDVGSIYVTGSDTECPPGWMVVESKNGVVFVDARSGAIDCQSMTYSTITTGDIKAFGSITIDENLGVTGNTSVAGDISSENINVVGKGTFGTLDIKGTSRFTGDVSFTENVGINSNLNVNGTISSSNSIKGNELFIKSRSILSGPVDLSDSLKVGGVSSFEGVITAASDLRVSGSINSANATIERISASSLKTTEAIDARGGIASSGLISSTGNIETTKDIVANIGRFSSKLSTLDFDAQGSVSISKTLTVEEKAIFNGQAVIGSKEADKLTVNGNAIFNNGKTSFVGAVDVNDDATFKSDLNVIGTLDLQSNANIRGSIDVSGPVVASASLSAKTISTEEQMYVGSDLNVIGITKIGGSIEVNDGAIIRGGISLGEDGKILTVSSNAQFNNNKTIFSGEVDITDVLNISGETHINSSITIDGALTAAGNTTVQGVLTANVVRTDAQAEFRGGISVGRQAKLEALVVDGKSIFNNDVNYYGTIAYNGDITTLSTSIATLGTVNVTKFINQSDNSGTNQFAASSIFNNDITIAGNATIKGSIISGTPTSGVTIEGNSVTLNGPTSLITSKTALIDKISGGATKVIGSISSRNSTAATKAVSLSNKRYTIMDNLYVEDSQVNASDIFCLGTLYVGDMQVIEVPGSNNRFDENSAVMNIRAARARYAP